MKKAVLLVDMGSPTSEEEMKFFLKMMFRDKAILPMNALMRSLLSFIISNARYKKSWKKYELIGGSPLKENDFALAAKLSEELNGEYYIRTAFTYTKPLIEEVAKEIYDKGFRELHILPLYPQFSYTTTGSVISEADKIKLKYKDLKIKFTENFYRNPYFIEYWKKLIDESIIKHKLESSREEGSLLLVYSAHSIPEYNIQKGDSYLKEINESAELISKAAGVDYRVGFQSKIGRVKWIEPDTKVLLRTLITNYELFVANNISKELMNSQARLQITNILLVPISFLSENLETKYDLDTDIIPYAKQELGFQNIFRVEIPKTHSLIIKTLKEIIAD